MPTIPHTFSLTLRRFSEVTRIVRFQCNLRDEMLRGHLNDDGAHSAATGIFPVRALDLIELESGLDRYGNLPVSEQFQELLQIGRKLL